MRTIDRSTRFKRDYKRESRAGIGRPSMPIFCLSWRALATDTPLDPKYRDHDLSGDWAGYRDCHVKPDLVLIYAKPDDETLRLRLGSHSGYSDR
jgi:mRNA interferase YafQ